jgi:hypothetical protein
MVDQAQVTEPDATQAPRLAARSSAEFVHDLLTLAELQFKLLAVDARQGLAGLIAPAVAVAGGIFVALGCLPVALAAVALALVETTDLTHAQSFGLVVAAAAVGGCVAIAVGAWVLSRRVRFLNRSLEEWQRNVQWVKETLKRIGRSPSAPSRWDGRPAW